MSKITAIVGLVLAILIMSPVWSAKAGEVALPSATALRAAIQHSKDVVAKNDKFRAAACAEQPKKLQPVCGSAYNLLNKRQEALRAELELILAVSQLPEPDRSNLARSFQDADRFNRNNKENGAIGYQVDQFFPVPRQSTQR